MEFQGFKKIPRLSRECVITEKIDGTNAQITITEEGEMFIGSRKRWITPSDDNYGFAAWCMDNRDDLMGLGVGSHFGEWWGQGIQRKYGMDRKVFSLFNTHRWEDNPDRPECCSVVPVLFQGIFASGYVNNALANLAEHGSVAAPGYMNPEGVVTFRS